MDGKLIILALLTFLVGIMECENEEQSRPAESLDDFCAIAPSGWTCEVITGNIDSSYFPKSMPEPEAVVKYRHPNRTFSAGDSVSQHASLVIFLYDIESKSTLNKQIQQQQLHSSCIPEYYGETANYFVVTSPCFINGGFYTVGANKAAEDLHLALRAKMSDHNRKLFGEILQ